MADRKMAIEFGLMTIQCRRASAIETPPKLTNLCTGFDKPHDPTPLKQDPSYCTICGEDTDKDKVVKGFGSGTTWTIVNLDTAEEAAEETITYRESLSLIAHPVAEINAATEIGEKVYYVTPEATSADHYALLVRLIQAHPELTFAGLLSLSKGGNAYLFSLRVKDNVLVLEERVRTEALKPAPVVAGAVNDKLLAMVETSLGMFVTPYDPEQYADKHAAAVARAIAAGTTTEGATPVATSDDDLMAKLAALSGKD